MPSPPLSHPPPEIAFDLHLEHGRCVGVRLPAPDAGSAIDRLAESELAPAERAFAAELSVARRCTWVGGRVALRRALAATGTPSAPPLLANDRGAPALPPGVAGSISHKETLAAALVAPSRPGESSCIGLDVELEAVRGDRPDIAPKVLTDAEAARLVGLDAPARAREVLLRFSAKEAIYKALDPFVRRYVGFKEVSVTPRSDGTADVASHLPEREGTFAIDVRWLRWEGFVLTTARVARR